VQKKKPEESIMAKNWSLVILATLALGLTNSPGQEKPTPEKPQRTDTAMKALAKIRQLGGLAMELAQNDPHLDVSYLQKEGKFSEEYLVPLKDLKGLVHLNLRGQDVTDAHLVYLKDLVTLTRLHLEKTKITDKGMEYLTGLVNLEYLNLYGTEITDAGLVHLKGMKKLKDLFLWQTKVSDEGVARLKQALPKVDIVRGLDLDKPKEEKKPEPKKEEPKKPEPKKEEAKPFSRFPGFLIFSFAAFGTKV
jgi:hypothetical protein